MHRGTLGFMSYAVYILASLKRAIYIGVTGRLDERVAEHKSKLFHEPFTAAYNIDRLVYLEHYDEIDQAIAREKQLKGWRRSKKVKLIESLNPYWVDFFVPPAPQGPSLTLGMTP